MVLHASYGHFRTRKPSLTATRSIPGYSLDRIEDREGSNDDVLQDPTMGGAIYYRQTTTLSGDLDLSERPPWVRPPK